MSIFESFISRAIHICVTHIYTLKHRLTYTYFHKIIAKNMVAFVFVVFVLMSLLCVPHNKQQQNSLFCVAYKPICTYKTYDGLRDSVERYIDRTIELGVGGRKIIIKLYPAQIYSHELFLIYPLYIAAAVLLQQVPLFVHVSFVWEKRLSSHHATPCISLSIYT